MRNGASDCRATARPPFLPTMARGNLPIHDRKPSPFPPTHRPRFSNCIKGCLGNNRGCLPMAGQETARSGANASPLQANVIRGPSLLKFKRDSRQNVFKGARSRQPSHSHNREGNPYDSGLCAASLTTLPYTHTYTPRTLNREPSP